MVWVEYRVTNEIDAKVLIFVHKGVMAAGFRIEFE